jgi:hypothetical protein
MRRFAPLTFALAVLTAAGTGRAETKPPVVIWPTLTPAGDSPGAVPLHKPAPVADKDAFARAMELDATLRDAVQDLGFDLYVADAGPAPGHTRDQDLIDRAAGSAASGAPEEGTGEGVIGARGTREGGTWVVSPRIEASSGGDYVVRIVAVPPGGRELRVRVETVPGDSVGVRGLVMLRDLLSPSAAAQAAVEQAREEAARGSAQGIMHPTRSQGRAVLAVNSALFGGFSAFSLQHSSGSDPDPRVLYPLLALGTGIGIGAALLVTDEWNITTGDAWFLSAGGWWGATSAFLIAAGHEVQPFADRYTWGVGGGLIGATLATFALTRGAMDDGDAMLAHSGGALGLLFGGAVQLLYEGYTPAEATPYRGMGYGTAAGLLAAGALATRVTTSPSRVLLIDVGLGGGALLGAAAASPLIFKNITKEDTRGWLSATIGGSVLGGALAWYLTRDSTPKIGWLPPGLPTAGVLGASASPGGSKPIFGIGWGGSLR